MNIRTLGTVLLSRRWPLCVANILVPNRGPAPVLGHALAPDRPLARRPHPRPRRRAQSAPATFYLGAVNGGVWKTTDAGDTWRLPLGRPALRLHRSHRRRRLRPQHGLRGSGEGLAAPRSLHRRRRLQVHRRRQDLDPPRAPRRPADRPARHRPPDPNRVFVAVTGHPYGPNKERGLYRSTTAARPSSRSSSPTTAPAAPRSRSTPTTPTSSIAGMWQRQEAPWENGSWIGADGGLYRSTDGGDHWTKLTGGMACPTTSSRSTPPSRPPTPRRVYAEVATTSGNSRPLPLRRRRRTWVHAPPTTPPRSPHRRRRRARPARRPQGSQHPLRRLSRHLEVYRRRQDLVRSAWRARRRRLPERLHQPEQHRKSSPSPAIRA